MPAAISLPEGFTVYYELDDAWLLNIISTIPFAVALGIHATYEKFAPYLCRLGH